MDTYMQNRNTGPEDQSKANDIASSLSLIIESYQSLPDAALDMPISHRDYLSLLTILRDALSAS
jgi:hypothetical protein